MQTVVGRSSEGNARRSARGWDQRSGYLAGVLGARGNMKARYAAFLIGISLILQSCAPVGDSPLPTSLIARTDTPPADMASPEPTPEPTSTAGSTPTADLTRFNVDTSVIHSPSGSWAAEITVAYPPSGSLSLPHEYYTSLVLVSEEDDRTLGVIKEWSEIGLGAPAPFILGWSSDEQFMYFADRSIPDGCARFAYVSHPRSLNLETAQILDLPSALERRISLSPDGGHIASIHRDEQEVLLYSVPDEGIASFSFDPKTEEWTAADFSWSPDGSFVFLPILHGAVCEEVSTSLIGIDLANREAWIFVDQYPAVAPYAEWVNSATVLLTGEQGETVQVDVGQRSTPR